MSGWSALLRTGVYVHLAPCYYYDIPASGFESMDFMNFYNTFGLVPTLFKVEAPLLNATALNCTCPYYLVLYGWSTGPTPTPALLSGDKQVK